MRPEMEHTSTGPETLEDEACVLTADEWRAVEGVVLWAMAVHATTAERIEREGGYVGNEWKVAAEAAAARAILFGAKDRTFQSHYPDVYSTGRA